MSLSSTENLYLGNDFSTPSAVRSVKRTQYAVYWPMRLGAKLMSSGCRMDLKLNQLSAHKGYVIAANHQSRIDPFIISVMMPLAYWKRLTPFRFFAYTELFKNVFLRVFLRACGAFPTRAFHNHPFGLAFAFQALGSGQSLFIFPEGRRTLPGEHLAKHGIAVLAQAPQTEIIPAHIQWYRHGWRRSFRLTVGKPFDGSQLSADDILQRIYDLPL